MTDIAIPGLEPAPPPTEWKLLAVIFGILIVLITVPLLRWRHQESHRPTLAEVRVVAATDEDPIFREGARVVGADETVRSAVALRLEYPGIGSRWLAPVDQLEIDGALIDHIKAETWPEEDRTARTFWFTLESPFLGGILTVENAQDRLAVRPFLAPEMGQAFLASREPESHADDGINLGDSLVLVNAGTYRLYARVEVVANDGSSRPLFAQTSMGADHIDNPSMVRISRDLARTFTLINPAVGHLFRLPGFEGPPDWDPTDACNRLVTTSSKIFAVMAVTGRCETDLPKLEELGTLEVSESGVASNLRWQTDVRMGDLIKHDNHWLVLISDDGDGVLNGPDLVVHSWRRPPAILPLGDALDPTPSKIGAFRIAGR